MLTVGLKTKPLTFYFWKSVKQVDAKIFIHKSKPYSKHHFNGSQNSNGRGVVEWERVWTRSHTFLHE